MPERNRRDTMPHKSGLPPFYDQLGHYYGGINSMSGLNLLDRKGNIMGVLKQMPASSFAAAGAKVEWPNQIISAGQEWTIAMRVKGGFPTSGYADLVGSKSYPGVESLYGPRFHNSVGMCCYTNAGTKYSYAQPPLATLQNYVATGCSLVWRFSKSEDQYKIKFWINGYSEAGWYINCGGSTPAVPYLYLSSLGFAVNSPTTRFTGTMWDFRAWNYALTATECAAFDTDSMSAQSLANVFVWLPNPADGTDVSAGGHHFTPVGIMQTAQDVFSYGLKYGFALYGVYDSLVRVPFKYGTTAIPTGRTPAGGTLLGLYPAVAGKYNFADGRIDFAGLDIMDGRDLANWRPDAGKTTESARMQLVTWDSNYPCSLHADELRDLPAFIATYMTAAGKRCLFAANKSGYIGSILDYTGGLTADKTTAVTAALGRIR